MTLLLSAHHISKSYGTQRLFKQLSFSIVQGDRIGLIGPNGAGKSTLLKIIMEMELPDEGYLSKKQNLRLGYASQVPVFPDVTLEEAMLLVDAPGDFYDRQTRARILLSKAQFTDFMINASSLSGGWKKRLDIARALMSEPDLLLLDEPTNHLDLEGILWLEQFLLRERCSYLIVSHDRYFLENVSNKIIEINKCYPQGLLISDGNMSTFMEHKEQFLEAQAQQQRGLASQVRDEQEWLRRSPKARTTKSRSRIQKAYELMDELSELKHRNKKERVDIDFFASERETKKLLVTKNLTKSLAGKPLFKGIDVTLSPGSRLGVVGKNGTGKTTLLKILAGLMSQDAGTVKYADDLRLVYFDQHREQVSPNATLKQALSPTSEYVQYRGQAIHVNGWAKKFLFSPDRLEMPVSCLSGGERARILIAKLMLEPADILFLDEPTNDLDIPTLEVFEDSLKEFAGAIVMISHDRCLMERLCTQILGLGENQEHQLFADFQQWEEASKEKKKISTPIPKPVAAVPSEVKKAPKKLTYQEQRELEQMEKTILNAESEIEQYQDQLNDPAIHTNISKAQEVYQSLSQAQQKLDALYARWQYLSEK